MYVEKNLAEKIRLPNEQKSKGPDWSKKIRIAQPGTMDSDSETSGGKEEG